jgi:hypothetical protein
MTSPFETFSNGRRPLERPNRLAQLDQLVAEKPLDASHSCNPAAPRTDAGVSVTWQILATPVGGFCVWIIATCIAGTSFMRGNYAVLDRDPLGKRHAETRRNYC